MRALCAVGIGVSRFNCCIKWNWHSIRSLWQSSAAKADEGSVNWKWIRFYLFFFNFIHSTATSRSQQIYSCIWIWIDFDYLRSPRANEYSSPPFHLIFIIYLFRSNRPKTYVIATSLIVQQHFRFKLYPIVANLSNFTFFFFFLLLNWWISQRHHRAARADFQIFQIHCTYRCVECKETDWVEFGVCAVCATFLMCVCWHLSTPLTAKRTQCTQKVKWLISITHST